MAIIYTYPDLGAVDGTEKLLVSDGSDENNTKTVTTAEYGAYINATYGGIGGLSIYQANGSITTDRTLSGGSNSLTFTGLNFFQVDSPTKFNGTVGLHSTIEIPTGANNGYVLTSNGSGFATWQAIPDSTILTINGVTNRVSVTDSGGPNTIIDIDSGYVGQPSITTLGTIATGTWNATEISTFKGGTGLTSYSQGNILYASAANVLSTLVLGTAGHVLIAGATVPAWQALTVDNSNWSGTALSSANGGTGQTTYAQGDILYADASGALAKLSPGIVDHVLTTKGAGVNPVWQVAPSAPVQSHQINGLAVNVGNSANITTNPRQVMFACSMAGINNQGPCMIVNQDFTVTKIQIKWIGRTAPVIPVDIAPNTSEINWILGKLTDTALTSDTNDATTNFTSVSTLPNLQCTSADTGTWIYKDSGPLSVSYQRDDILVLYFSAPTDPAMDWSVTTIDMAITMTIEH